MFISNYTDYYLGNGIFINQDGSMFFIQNNNKKCIRNFLLYYKCGHKRFIPLYIKNHLLYKKMFIENNYFYKLTNIKYKNKIFDCNNINHNCLVCSICDCRIFDLSTNYLKNL